MAGLSIHQPEKFDKKRADEQAIAERIREIREELVEPLADENTVGVCRR